MSEILWSHRVVPPADAPVEDRSFDLYEPTLVIPRTRAIPASNRKLVVLPDRRSYRSLSRAGVLFCAAGLPARAVLAPFLERDRQRVGIYAAAATGPQNYRAAKQLSGVREGFAEQFRRLNHPKLYFTQLANLPAAQLAIFLDVRGPVNVYKHSTHATLHALEQAELDLASGLIDAALHCAAMSLEDPLLCLQERRSAGTPHPPVLSEGAGALVLGPGGEARNWSTIIDEPKHGGVSYGIADPVLRIIDKETSP